MESVSLDESVSFFSEDSDILVSTVMLLLLVLSFFQSHMSEGLNPFFPNATFLYPPEKGYIGNELVNESLPLGTLLLLQLSALLSARKVSKYGVFLVRIFPPLD